MHTCLTLANVGGQRYVERDVSRLISALAAHCGSIHSCDVGVEGPGGEDAARYWRVELRVRVFDETVRAAACAPEGNDSQQSLSRALADIYASARAQLEYIAEQHHGCCTHCA